MQSIYNHSLVRIICTAMAFALTQSARSAPRPNGAIQLKFALRQASVTVHEPIQGALSIHNELGRPIHVDLGKDCEENIEFAISPPQGGTSRGLRIARAGIGTTCEIEVLPGGNFSHEFELNRWYAFGQTGRYQVEPKIDASFFAQEGKLPVMGAAEILWIDILPRDPTRLGQVCQSLSQVALNAKDLTTRVHAARTLGLMQDIVAAPYLAQLAAKGAPFHDIAVDGLARIAEVEGLDVVITSLGPLGARIEPDVRENLRLLRLHVTQTD